MSRWPAPARSERFNTRPEVFFAVTQAAFLHSRLSGPESHLRLVAPILSLRSCHPIPFQGENTGLVDFFTFLCAVGTAGKSSTSAATGLISDARLQKSRA